MLPARATLILGFFTFGCGPKPGAATAQAPHECSATLETRRGGLESIPAAKARSVPLSQIVVHAEAPLAPLQAELEAQIQSRLAEGRFGIGPAGRVSYNVERGPIAVSVAAHQLVVETVVHAQAAACRGENCYASCEPEAIVTAQVPLLLRPDYGFDHAKLALRFTRGCQIRALGGFLTVDVTPTLGKQLEPVLARAARQIDERLDNVRQEVERAWAQLSIPRELPLGGCLVLQPQRVVQGPLTDSKTSLHPRFGILAQPELRSTCTDLPASPPLPALERNLSLPDEGPVRLGLVTPLEALSQALTSAPEIAFEQGKVRVNRAQLTSLGSDIMVQLTLSGDVCGELAFVATPSFAKDAAFIGLSRPRWLVGERERVAEQDLNPDQLLQALAAAPRLPPKLSAAALPSAVPPMAKMLSTPELDIRAQVSSAQGAGAAARGDELVAWIEMLGRLDLGLKNLRKP